MRRRHIALLAVAALVCGVAGWSFGIEPGLLREREVLADTARWPKGRPGLRLVVASDLHVGAPHVSHAYVEDLVARINRQNPDIVLLAGDYVCHVLFGRAIDIEPIAEQLGRIKARHGVYAVLGNHDWVYDGPRVQRALEAKGIVVLENANQLVQTGGGPVRIVGVSDAYTRRDRIDLAFQGVGDDEVVVALTHDPAIFPRVPISATILIAGHTHGGQVNPFFTGPLINASAAPLRHTYGLIREGQTMLYVTSGIGTSVVPVRFNRPPEFAIVTLRAPR